MRVLLTTDTIGGVWTFTKELTEGLLERSHSVALVSFGRLPTPGQQSWISITEGRYPADFRFFASAAPLEWMENNEDSYPDGEALLLRIASDVTPDLLHTNQFCYGKLPLEIPRLVVVHSDVMSWAAACRPGGLEPSPWLRRYQRLVQDGLSESHLVVTPSDWMRDALSAHFDVRAPVCTIHNGRSISVSWAESPRKLQAVTAGRLWDEAKGLSILSEQETPIPVLVAGDVRQSSTALLPEQATLLGPLSEESLIRLFSESSFYLALSVYEPFGLAPLEAALCGCAIIARDIPSLREIWGDAALFFNNATSLNAHLAVLASSPDLRTDFQERAYARALTFNRSRMTEQYLELYRGMVRPELDPQPSNTEASLHAS